MKKQFVSKLCYMLIPCGALLLADRVGAEETKTPEVVESDALSGLTAELETLVAQIDPSDDQSTAAAEESAEVSNDESDDDGRERADRRRERPNRSRGEFRRGPRGPRDDRAEWSRRRRPDDGPGDGRSMRRGPGRSFERQMRERRDDGRPRGPRGDWRQAGPDRPERFGRGSGRPGGGPWGRGFGPPSMSGRPMAGPPVAVAEMRQLRAELTALRTAIEALTEVMRK